MDLSNLKPAAGSTHNDNFRRGRGEGTFWCTKSRI